MRLLMVMLLTIPVWIYGVFWDLSAAHYYGSLTYSWHGEGAGSLSMYLSQHAVLLPGFVLAYYLAADVFMRGGRPGWLIAKQALLLLLFVSLVRPALLLAQSLGGDAPAVGGSVPGFVAQLNRQHAWFHAAVNYSLIYSVGLCALFGLSMLLKYREERYRATALRSDWLQTQLVVLRRHLHPHFLFNTLNTISSLVGSKPDTARELIVELAALLRDSTRDGMDEFYSLDRERQLAEKYLRIIRARFGENPALGLQMEDWLGSYAVPRGLLLTLLENAVTHGISSLPGKRELRVVIGTDGGRLMISMRNSFSGRPGTRTVGHRGGLDDLERRLSVLYGVDFDLSYGPTLEGDWLTRVNLPLVQRQETPAAGE